MTYLKKLLAPFYLLAWTFITPLMHGGQYYFPEAVWEWIDETENVTTRINSILPLADDGVVAAGYKTIAGHFHPWVVRISSTGTVLWEETFNDTGLVPRSTALQVAYDQTGDLLVLCPLWDFSGSLLLRLNTVNGGLVEVNHYPGYAYSALIRTDGSMILAGTNFVHSYAAGSTTPQATAQIALAGNWVGRGLALLEDAGGNIVVGGSCGPTAGSERESFIARFNSQLQMVSSERYYDGSHYEQVRAMHFMPDGRIAAVGQHGSTGLIFMVDAANQREWMLTGFGYSSAYNSVALSTEGHLLAAGTLQSWRTSDTQPHVRAVGVDGEPIYSYQRSGEGGLLAILPKTNGLFWTVGFNGSHHLAGGGKGLVQSFSEGAYAGIIITEVTPTPPDEENESQPILVNVGDHIEFRVIAESPDGEFLNFDWYIFNRITGDYDYLEPSPDCCMILEITSDMVGEDGVSVYLNLWDGHVGEFLQWWLVVETPSIEPMSGSYSIDPNAAGERNFTTFTAAVNALNLRGVVGAVQFQVATGSVFDEVLPVIAVSGADGAEIAFAKAGEGLHPVVRTAVAEGQSHEGILRLQGVRYLHWQGIDLECPDGSVTHGIVFLDADHETPSLAEGCQHNVFSNFTVQGVSGSGIHMVSGDKRMASGPHSYNRFQNLVIRSIRRDASSQGGNGFIMMSTGNWLGSDDWPFTYRPTGNVIEHCMIGSAEGVLEGKGIVLFQTQNTLVKHNTLTQVTDTAIRVTESSGTELSYNHIHGLLGASQTGIYLDGKRLGDHELLQPTRIHHNRISLLGFLANQQYVTGIEMGGLVYTHCFIDFNSVRVETTPGAISTALKVNYFLFQGSGLRVSNNILADFSPLNDGLGRHAAMTVQHLDFNAVGAPSNYNLLHQLQGNVVYVVNLAQYLTLPQWVSQSSQDFASRQGDPAFSDNISLRLSDSVPTPAAESGGYHFSLVEYRDFSWITADADGTVRKSVKPTIGAWEGDFPLMPLLPEAAYPESPFDGQAGVRAGSSFRLSWNLWGQDPQRPVDQLEIYFSSDESAVAQLAPESRILVTGDLSANAFTVNYGLQPETVYFWRVVTTNVAGATVSPVVSFTTAALAVLPLRAGFNDEFQLDEGWSSLMNDPFMGGDLQGNGLGQTHGSGWSPSGDFYARSGAGAATFFGGYPAYYWLISPEFIATANTTIHFWLRYTASEPEAELPPLHVLFGSSGLWYSLTTYHTDSADDYLTEFVIDLSTVDNIEGKLIAIAWVLDTSESMGGFDWIGIDDIRIGDTYQNPAPVNQVYDDWMETLGITDVRLRKLDKDAANDGISNMMKYAVGIHPLQRTLQKEFFDVARDPMQNGSISVEYYVSKTKTGIRLIPEWSLDLHNWSAEGFSKQMIADQEDRELWRATLTGVEKAFVRLRATVVAAP